MKKRFFFYGYLVFIFFLLFNIKIDDKVKADIYIPIIPNDILDISEITINDLLYTVILRTDKILVVDDTGKTIKTLNHNIETMNEGKIKVIDDIDNKGVSDFLIVIRGENNVANFITISYEANKILWQYKSTMKSLFRCGPLEYCDLPTVIENYEIKENLYFVSGYSLKELNIKTGKVIKEYNYSNNIWDFEFIPDANNNGTEDIVIAIQPTKLYYLDGKDFSKFAEMNVATNYEITNITNNKKLYKIKRNVYDLMFSKDQNILYALSEDGFIYSIKNQKIVNNAERIKVDDYFYRDIYQEENRDYSYEVTSDGYYVFGRSLITQTGGKLYPYSDDLILVHNYSKNTIGLCTVSKCDNYDEKATEFLKKNDQFIVYSKQNKRYVKTLETNEIHDSIYGDIYLLSNRYIVKENNRIKTYDKNHQLILDIDFNQKNIDFTIIDNYLVSQNENQITIKNSDMETLIDYTSLGMIEHVMNDNEFVYFVETVEDDYFFKIFNLLTKTFVSEKTLNESMRKFIADNELTLDNYFILPNFQLYDDINGDDIKEIILECNINDQRVIIIYDSIKNSIIDYKFISNPNTFVYVINDVSNDGRSEVLTYSLDEAKTVFTLYLTESNNILNHDIQEFEFDLDLTNYRLSIVDDLNNDLYPEVFFEESREDYSKTLITQIIDLKNKKTTEFVNQNSDKLHDIVQVIDLDNDNIKEIISFHDEQSQFIHMQINNYSNNGNLDLTYRSLMMKTDENIYNNLYLLEDLTGDGILDIIFYSYYGNNSHFSIFDYNEKQFVQHHQLNVLKNKEIHNFDFNALEYYGSIEKSKIGEKNYLIIKDHDIDSNYYPSFSFIAFIDMNTFKVDFLTNYYVGIMDNQLVYKMGDKYKKVKPILYEDIHVNQSNLLKNTYTISIDDQRSNSIIINTRYFRYPELTKKTNKVYLPDGDYGIWYMIVTEDGGVFYYYDSQYSFFNLPHYFFKISLFIGGIVTVYIFTKKGIYKYYFHK